MCLGIQKEKTVKVIKKPPMLKHHDCYLPCHNQPDILAKFDTKNIPSARGTKLLKSLKKGRKMDSKINGFYSTNEPDMFFVPLSLQEKVNRWMSTIPVKLEPEQPAQSFNSRHKAKTISTEMTTRNNTLFQAERKGSKISGLSKNAKGDDANQNLLLKVR